MARVQQQQGAGVQEGEGEGYSRTLIWVQKGDGEERQGVGNIRDKC
jgi:hypothetical protein